MVLVEEEFSFWLLDDLADLLLLSFWFALVSALTSLFLPSWLSDEIEVLSLLLFLLYDWISGLFEAETFPAAELLGLALLLITLDFADLLSTWLAEHSLSISSSIGVIQD